MVDMQSTEEKKMALFKDGPDNRRFVWTAEALAAHRERKAQGIEKTFKFKFSRAVDKEDFSTIRELYVDHGVSCRELGRKWDCSATVISRILKAAGINPRIGRPKVEDGEG